ncbi:MAG: 4Fe-4S binding protein [Desulforhopalus sp.]
MSKFFSTCMLVREGTAAAEFLPTEIPLSPGNRLSPPESESALLCGGFSNISPESDTPVSPTLHLNYALGVFSPDQLRAIGEAELARLNEVRYRSYTLDADNRVCVIAENARDIERFIDTYGGVLDIEPLLLKSYHPGMETVVELKARAEGDQCCLAYTVRSPIDLNRCTYCGVCGPACPAQCISETLFVNFAACTFCRECENACPTNAVDVHGALDKNLEIPAIITLGKISIDLPWDSGRVYGEGQLADYFASLSAYQVDEVVACENSICQYSSRFADGCDLCLSSCRFGAIIHDDRGVTVNPLKCQECGACMAVCPTGALQNQRFSDHSFVRYFQKTPVPQDGTVVVGGEADLHRLWWQQQKKKRENVFFLQYDNVQSLSLFHCLHLLAKGARRILFLFADDFDRPTPQFQQQLTLGKTITESLFDREDALIVCRLNEFDTVMKSSPQGSFGSMLPLDEFVSRRQALAAALRSLVEKSGRQIDIHPEDDLPFATVSCDRDRCTQCLACLNDCRIGALVADQQQYTLSFIGAMCVGCGLCVRVCPENALSISPECTIRSEFFARLELAKAEPMTCRSCGKVFGTKNSFDRVMAMLSKKEKVDTSHFEYCGDCRVIKLFE